MSSKITGPIYIYMPAFNGGGAENAIVRLLNFWVNTDLDVRLIVNQNTGPLKDKLSSDVHVTALGVKSTFANIPRLVRHLRKSPPAALMTALLSPNVAGVLAARLTGANIPVICLARNHTSRELSAMPAWRRTLIKPMLQFAYNRTDAIGCVASQVSQDLVTLFNLPEEKVHDTFNPIILPPSDATYERPDYFPTGKPIIVAVGRLVYQKDYDTVLQAFAKLRKTKDAALVILGQGPLLETLETLCRDLGIQDDVVFAGFQSNPLAALAHADLFTLLSRFEGFPNVIGEALSMGCTIAATDAPGGTCDILEHGTFGNLVAVGDVDAAAAALLKGLDFPADPKQQIARASEFSLEAISERYITLCEYAIEARS